MNISRQETIIFNSSLDAITNRKKNLVTIYRNTQNIIEDQIASYRLKLEKGEITSRVQEKRLQELYKQIDDETAKLYNQIEGQIKAGYKENYIESYYQEAYLFENKVNIDLARENTKYILNYPVLPVEAIDSAFSERIAGHTFTDRMINDRTVMRYKLRQAVAEVLIEGLPPKELKKRLMTVDDVFKSNEAKAMNTARTEMLKAYSLGVEKATDEAVKSGVQFEYQWSSGLDTKTRSDHKRIDGQTAEIVDGLPMFQVGGVLFSSPRVTHPNNFASAGSQIVNCRCRRLNNPFGIEPTRRVYKMSNGEYNSVRGDMKYPEWKKAIEQGTIIIDTPTSKAVGFSGNAHPNGPR